MKQFIMVLCVLLVIGGVASAEGRGEKAQLTADADVLEELVAMERGALDLYYGQSDPTLYAEQFGDRATYFDPWSGGKIENDAIKAYLMGFKGLVPETDFEIRNPSVDVLGDIAILTFSCDATDVASGAMTPWNVGLIYRQTGDGWEKIHANWNYEAAQPASGS